MSTLNHKCRQMMKSDKKFGFERRRISNTHWRQTGDLNRINCALLSHVGTSLRIFNVARRSRVSPRLLISGVGISRTNPISLVAEPQIADRSAWGEMEWDNEMSIAYDCSKPLPSPYSPARAPSFLIDDFLSLPTSWSNSPSHRRESKRGWWNQRWCRLFSMART